MKLSYLTTAFLMVLVHTSAFAGIMELGGSVNRRFSKIDANNFQETESYTGSFSYYFMEQSALEVSYTQGDAILSTKASGESAIIYRTQFKMIGADIVFSFASRKSAFQPFIKGGGAQLNKKVYRELADGSISKISETNANSIVPSGGAGFKFLFTETMSLKASYDMWKSASTDDAGNWDNAIRVGISWMF